jgi:hypothetical protein
LEDPIYKLRSATRRAKSDVANKLVSMCLHELSRRISQGWPIKVDGEEYEELVRGRFNSGCPYCSCNLTNAESVIEHLDGMNRYRAGLHVPGNVLVACRRCNSEKRRDDSLKILSLARTGWEFLPISRWNPLRFAMPHLSILGEYLGGCGGAQAEVRREPAEDPFVSQRLSTV